MRYAKRKVADNTVLTLPTGAGNRRTPHGSEGLTAEIHALDVIEQRAEKGEITAAVARKILDDNPRRFYGLWASL